MGLTIVSAQRYQTFYQKTQLIDARRYEDLKLLALHYMPDFDERKYWAYGCNCLILGDRPMSDLGFGRPVDRLDNVCKAYKVKIVFKEFFLLFS